MINRLLAYKRPVSLKDNGELLISITVLLLIFIMAATAPVDTDFWWHLKNGQMSWLMGTPIMIDQFSFTRAGILWTNHEWLAEIGMYGLYTAGGFLAIGAAVAALATISLGLVYMQIDGPALLKAFILVLAATVSAPVWVPRPEITSLVMLAVVSYLLFLYKWRKTDRIWMFIPIFILWGNLHGGYVLGIGLIGCVIAGELINHFLGYKGEEILSYKRIGRLAVWLILSLLAVLINPNGIRMWLIPFQTVGINALQNYIVEWASPDFHQFFQQSFIWMVLAIIAAVGLSKKRLDASDLVTIAVFIYAALIARRNYGPFAIVAAPVLGRYLWPAMETWYLRVKPDLDKVFHRFKISNKANNTTRLSTIQMRTRIINFAIVGLMAFVAIGKLYVVTSPQIVNPYEKRILPVDAVSWIESNHPQGNLFNSYNWGGYLLWALPDYPVFVDGRTDLYSDKIIGQWLTVVNARDGWQTVLNEWGVHLILLEPDWPIVKILPYDGWKVLYKDSTAVIFGR